MLLLPHFIIYYFNAPVFLCFCPHLHFPPSARLLLNPSPIFTLTLVFLPLFLCLVFVYVFGVLLSHLQIPTGPLIFNSLQQQQLSQFSPQQSQSATSSPQQQGETVRHAPLSDNCQGFLYSEIFSCCHEKK